MPIGDSPERVGRLDSWFSSSSNHADVPKQVRQFLIALRAFEEDVQLLVALRNEHRSSIQLQPVILERMSNVIGTAQRVLAEIQEEMIYTSWVGRRQSPFQMLRGRSSSSSSSAVQSLARLRTLAETHHGATLAEIYRVRQIASLEPAASRSQPSMNSTQQAVDLDEMRRLAELLPTQGVSLSAPWPHLMRASPATTKAAELDASNEICRPNSRAGSHISASAPPVEMIANEDVKRDIPRIVSYKTPGWSQDESKGANNDVKSQSLRVRLYIHIFDCIVFDQVLTLTLYLAILSRIVRRVQPFRFVFSGELVCRRELYVCSGRSSEYVRGDRSPLSRPSRQGSCSNDNSA